MGLLDFLKRLGGDAVKIEPKADDFFNKREYIAKYGKLEFDIETTEVNPGMNIKVKENNNLIGIINVYDLRKESKEGIIRIFKDQIKYDFDFEQDKDEYLIRSSLKGDNKQTTKSNAYPEYARQKNLIQFVIEEFYKKENK